ncbi:FtsX-like permease family protein [Bacteroidota bacterium]
MFTNYLKIALRNILKQRTYSIINIIGLTVGIAAFLLIVLYIQNELSFDSNIPYKDRVYRCVEIQHPAGVDDQHVAMTMAPLGPRIKEDFPEVEEFTRILSWGGIPITYEGDRFHEPFLVHADSTVFDIFGIKLIAGDEKTALSNPTSIIMQEDVAIKYFGSVEEAIGKIVDYDNYKNLKVTAVMENQPKRSHQRMELIVPFELLLDKYTWMDSWGSNTLTTYVRLKPNTSVKSLESKFHEWLLPIIEPDDTSRLFQLYLQDVGDIHLKSNHIKFQRNHSQGNITMVYVFSITAFLIILIACVNYINMAIARSFKRSKEVGIRKVLGANRQTLMYQFLGESVAFTFISILLALIVVELLLSFFNSTFNVSLDMDFVHNPIFNIGLLILLIVVSLFSGSYPAFYLSRFKPIKVLKGGTDKKLGGSGNLTKVLVVFQFVISISLIISISVTYAQFHYAMNKDMGINYSNVLNINTYNIPESNIENLRNDLASNPNIQDMCQSSYINGVSGSQNTLNVDDSASTPIACRVGVVDYDFFEMMGVPIIMGRNFDKRFSTDECCAIILNQAAVDYFGWENPLEKSFQAFWSDTTLPRKVIGVIQDYHYYNLHSKIEPAAYILYPDQYYSLLARVDARSKEETLKFIEEKWMIHNPGIPFSAQYADQIIKDQYSDDADNVKMFSFFTILSILVSCLGLYGLTAFMIEQKKREIGIRKVYGSNVAQILKLIINDFIKLILIAGVIASAISWYFMDSALNNFAYRISLSWYYFVGGILVAIIIAILTILYHSIKAALSNPVDSLRYE